MGAGFRFIPATLLDSPAVHGYSARMTMIDANASLRRRRVRPAAAASDRL
jgi:hypothetical protein